MPMPWRLIIVLILASAATGLTACASQSGGSARHADSDDSDGPTLYGQIGVSVDSVERR